MSMDIEQQARQAVQDESIRQAYNDAARHVRIVFECFVEVGFTDEQALRLTLAHIEKMGR